MIMAMKESGIEWVGLIPDTWSVIPNKYVMHKEKNLCEEWSGEDVMSLTMNGVIVRDLQNPTGKMPATFDGYQYIEDGDLLMCLFDIDVTPRCVGRVTHNGVTSPAYSNFKVHDNASRDYFYYYYLMVDNTKELLHLAKNLRHSFTEEQLGQLKVPMPPLSEQQAIADYLDETCSKIDEIIAEAKASIDEYKELKQSVIDKAVLQGLCNGMMKDFGNDLIGKIPLSWEMRKLKYVADFNPSITIVYDTQKEVGYVPMNCVKNGYMNPLSARLSDMSTGLTGFQDGDIVMAKVTPCFENGNIAVAENLEQGVAFGSSELFVIRTHSINRRFMLYYLQNNVFKNQCISTMTGTGGLKRVSGYFVNNAYITYPPENEQHAIVDYLDEAVKTMDSLIAEKESLINDLEAYKKSLIYEVVTGKRRVV